MSCPFMLISRIHLPYTEGVAAKAWSGVVAQSAAMKNNDAPAMEGMRWLIEMIRILSATVRGELEGEGEFV